MAMATDLVFEVWSWSQGPYPPPPWRPTMGDFEEISKIDLLALPPSSPREGGGGYGPGDHDPDLKDQICDHIPSQAPQWGPTWHYYNTC